MTALFIFAAFLAGALLAGIVVTLMLQARIVNANARAESSFQPQLATLNERLASRDQQLEELRRDLRQQVEQIAALQNELTAHKTMRAEMETTLSKERQAAQEKLALLNDAQAKLSDAFKALSSDALRSRSST